MTGFFTLHKALIIKGLRMGLAGIDLAINEARCYANKIKVHEEMIASRGRERKKIKMQKRYWIQEQAPDGGYYDSVGLSPDTTEEEAKLAWVSWKKSYPNRVVILVLKTTTPICH